MNYEKFKRSDRPDRFRSLTLLSAIFSPILDEACLSVGKVTDEVRKARQRSTDYTG
jgi:hypothetical protein